MVSARRGQNLIQNLGKLMNKTEYYAVHSQVLIVAVHRVDGWAAYVTPVPGVDHRYESAVYWQRDGEKLSAKQAAVFFPHLDVNNYAR